MGRGDTLALMFAIAFPTLVTWGYFVALRDESPALQQSAYSLGKAIQFAFPAGWAWWTGRLIFRSPYFSKRGTLTGILFGAAVAGATIGLYFGWLKSSEFSSRPPMPFAPKVAGIGVQSAGSFVALGAFYSLCHSLMEEYYGAGSSLACCDATRWRPILGWRVVISPVHRCRQVAFKCRWGSRC